MSYQIAAMDYLLWHLYATYGTGGAIIASSIVAYVHPEDIALTLAGDPVLGDVGRWVAAAGVKVEERADVERGKVAFAYILDSCPNVEQLMQDAWGDDPRARAFYDRATRKVPKGRKPREGRPGEGR